MMTLPRPFSLFSSSASVLHNLADELAVLDVCLELLRDGVLGVVLFSFRRRQVNVDAGALAAEDFRFQAFIAQVDGGTVDLIQQESW